MSNDHVYHKAIKHYGRVNQICQLTEELAEAIAAVNQFKRGRIGLKDLAREFADCEIMLEQMRIIFGGDNIEYEKKIKIDRLSKILDTC